MKKRCLAGLNLREIEDPTADQSRTSIAGRICTTQCNKRQILFPSRFVTSAICVMYLCGVYWSSVWCAACTGLVCGVHIARSG